MDEWMERWQDCKTPSSAFSRQAWNSWKKQPRITRVKEESRKSCSYCSCSESIRRLFASWNKSDSKGTSVSWCLRKTTKCCSLSNTSSSVLKPREGTREEEQIPCASTEEKFFVFESRSSTSLLLRTFSLLRTSTTLPHSRNWSPSSREEYPSFLTKKEDKIYISSFTSCCVSFKSLRETLFVLCCVSCDRESVSYSHCSRESSFSFFFTFKKKRECIFLYILWELVKKTDT